MRSAHRIAALTAAVVLSACSASAQDAEAPLTSHMPAWSMYQYSPGRNAVFESSRTQAPWAYDAKAKINGGLALAGDTLLFTTFAHNVVALDTRNGRELWTAAVSNVAMSTPIVAGSAVYVGTGKNGELDKRANLALRFRFAGKDVWGGRQGDEIAAFNLRDGKRLWTYRTVGEDMPSAVYDGGRLIFANGDWHAYALRADTGEQLWSTDVGGVSTMSSAVIAGKNVVVGVCTDGISKSSAVALDPATGRIVWRSNYGHCDSSPAYGDGKVFLSSVEPTKQRYVGRTVVAAVDANTGRTIWRYRSAAAGLWTIVASDESAIAGTYVGGTYYQAAPLDRKLLAFDGATGKLRWSFDTAGPVKMSPVIKNGRLYVGDTVGVLYTLDAASGKLLELRPFKKPFTTSPPIVAGNTIFIVNGTSVYAMPLSGETRFADSTGS
ncbi:MAG TPA: PQQ-binding-like beta-propeller repeat protein [Candidatus Baltobacteraceae bacterium]|nr:PQQ-binding-like beta-propeller repeat protein [Candidatus Baltobacteraceae bacterium]